MKCLPTVLAPRATHLTVTDTELIIRLRDGRSISVPLAFYPTLVRATPRQRQAFSVLGDGEGFTWEGLDLDLSVRGIVEGVPERVAPPALRERWKQAAAKLATRRRAAGSKSASPAASKGHASKLRKAV